MEIQLLEYANPPPSAPAAAPPLPDVMVLVRVIVLDCVMVSSCVMVSDCVMVIGHDVSLCYPLLGC